MDEPRFIDYDDDHDKPSDTRENSEEYYDAPMAPQIFSTDSDFPVEEGTEVHFDALQDNDSLSNKIRPYAEPILQSQDSRRYVSGRASLTGAYQRARSLFGLSEDAAPYGRDKAGSALFGPVQYEQHNTSFDKLNLTARWSQERQTLESKGYEFVGQIGSGGFADVWEVKYKERQLACKIMEIRRFTVRKSLKVAVDNMTNEIDVLRGLAHPHILSIDTAIYIPDAKSDFHSLFVFILMDLMEGSLMNLIYSWKRFKQEEALDWFQQISDGLYYLHEHNVSHLDIKPQNILYHRINQKFIYKLGDFGISKAFGEDVPNVMEERWGTPLFKAPELCARKPNAIIDYLWPQEYDTKACDIYSLGVTLGLSLIGKLMSIKTSAHQWIKENLVGKQDKTGISWALLIDLLYLMTQPDPIRRYRIQNVIDHPWLKMSLRSIESQG